MYIFFIYSKKIVYLQFVLGLLYFL